MVTLKCDPAAAQRRGRKSIYGENGADSIVGTLLWPLWACRRHRHHSSHKPKVNRSISSKSHYHSWSGPDKTRAAADGVTRNLSNGLVPGPSSIPTVKLNGCIIVFHIHTMCKTHVYQCFITNVQAILLLCKNLFNVTARCHCQWTKKFLFQSGACSPFLTQKGDQLF